MSRRRETTLHKGASPAVVDRRARAEPPAGPSENGVARAADAVVEASWLVTVSLIPLYFPPASAALDAHKANLLVGLAILAAGAWVIGQWTRPGEGTRWRAGNPLLWAGLGLFASYAVATVLSIDPRLSFFGSQTRNQGLLTHAAYAVFFLAVATRLRRREQLDRLVSVLLVASVPALIYGIAQQVGIDPAPSNGDPATIQWPVRASFGNHIFFGAYLILLIPLTASRLVATWTGSEDATTARSEWPAALFGIAVAGVAYIGYLALAIHRQSMFVVLPAALAGYPLLAIALDRLSGSTSTRTVRRAAYGVLLALQVLTLVLTSARGPLLGFLVTIPVFALLLAWRLHRARIFQAGLACAGVLALFLLVFNIPNGPLQSLQSIHSLNRVANLRGYASESSGAGRLLVWDGFTTLMRTHPAIGNTWGGPARDLVGYGPESQEQAFEVVFPRLLRVETSEQYTWDRAHSIYLDVLVEAGALGLLAFIATYLCFFAQMVLAIRRAEGTVSWIFIAVVTAVLAHLVEGIFGLETATTGSVVWLLLGLGASPLARGVTQAEPASTPAGARNGISYGVGVLLAMGLAALLGSLTDYPRVFAALLLGGMIAGVGAVAAAVVQRSSVQPDRKARNRPAQVTTIPRRTKILSGVVTAVVLACLVVPWQFQTAASAEAAGFANLTSARVDEGLSDLQEAAGAQANAPKHAEDLATVYLALATVSAVSAEPGYVPRGDDWKTVSPQAAQTLGRKQLIQLAVLALRSAESTAPLDPAIHGKLGDALLQEGRFSEAMAEYRHAQRLSHANPAYLDDQALVYLATHRVQQALALAQAANRLDTTFWFSHYALARAYASLGRRSHAQLEARLALAFVPNARPGPPADQLKQLHTLERSGRV